MRASIRSVVRTTSIVIFLAASFENGSRAPIFAESAVRRSFSSGQFDGASAARRYSSRQVISSALAMFVVCNVTPCSTPTNHRRIRLREESALVNAESRVIRADDARCSSAKQAIDDLTTNHAGLSPSTNGLTLSGFVG